MFRSLYSVCCFCVRVNVSCAAATGVNPIAVKYIIYRIISYCRDKNKENSAIKFSRTDSRLGYGGFPTFITLSHSIQCPTGHKRLRQRKNYRLLEKGLYHILCHTNIKIRPVKIFLQ
jgi:hypothetical protein